jgi:RNA polymerase sigma-70 factor (ECF subfamily)
MAVEAVSDPDDRTIGARDVSTVPTMPASDRSTHSPEAALVLRLKAGDGDAFEELVRAAGGRLLAVARRLLRDEEAARDAVQDAFLCAFRSIQGFDGNAQLSTWLHRIVVNAALMRIRSRQRRPELSIEPMLPTFAEDGHHAEPVVSWAESAAHALESKETRALVRAAIEELPETYRTVLMLRDLEDLSTREAADVLGASENAIKLRLHRARQALAVIIRRRLSQPAGAGSAPGASQTVASSRTKSTLAAPPSADGPPSIVWSRARSGDAGSISNTRRPPRAASSDQPSPPSRSWCWQAVDRAERGADRENVVTRSWRAS